MDGGKKLTLNKEKTQVMNIYNKEDTEGTVSFVKEVLRNSKCAKYLGVWLDCKTGKVSKNTYILWKIKVVDSWVFRSM